MTEPGTAVRPNRSSAFVNSVLVVSSLVLSFILLEISLQILRQAKTAPPEEPKSNWALAQDRHWVEHHDNLGWFNQKSKIAKLRFGDSEIPMTLNSAGFRSNREYDSNPSEGIRRILILGDSFVFGWGVRDHQTVSARLEQDHDIEAVNLGVVGFGVDQIYLAYQEIGRNLNPDIVIISIYEEDFWRATRAFADTGHAKPYFTLRSNGELVLQQVPVPPKFSVTTGQFPELFEHVGMQAVLNKSELYKLVSKSWIRLGKNLGFIDPDLTAEWKLGRAILEKAVRDIRASGSMPVLMTVPSTRWVKSEKNVSVHRSLLRFARRHKVAVVDITDDLRRRIRGEGIEKYYIKDDWHWTTESHQIAADAILKSLSELTPAS